MLVAGIVSDITTWVTDAIGSYGLYAVFLLMLIDAVFPAASEVVMVYGGAVASGAFAGQAITLFGYHFESGLPAYLAVAIAGTVGYLIGVDRRLGARRLPRASVARAPRQVAASERREPRPRRAVVRPLGGMGSVPRSDHAGDALVHLHSGGCLPRAVRGPTSG